MKKILISYIIPAYNAADTLERAVESITHTCNMEKCEILIVENGSTDYTKYMKAQAVKSKSAPLQITDIMHLYHLKKQEISTFFLVRMGINPSV